MNIQALHFVLDIDGNGTISGWEILAALKWGYALPGRLVVEGLGSLPLIADTFGIEASPATGYASFNSLLTTGISLVFWAGLLVLLMRIGTKDDTASGTASADANPVGAGTAPHYRGPKPKRRFKSP